MRVYLGSDHAGFELKSVLANWLASAGHEVTDCGPASYHEHDDYPPYVMRAAAAAAADPGSVAIVIGGSGNGEQIAANKIAGIRAALVWSEETARLARLHNDANVLSLGARMHPAADAIAFTQVFLATPFSGEATACAAAGDDHGVRAVRGAPAAPRLGVTGTGTGQRDARPRRSAAVPAAVPCCGALLRCSAARLAAPPAAAHPLAAGRGGPMRLVVPGR